MSALRKDNPVAKIKKKKIPKNHPVFITEEEFNRLIELEHNQLAKSVYILAFYTGCRISELLNIRWKDIDIANNKIAIKNHLCHTTKSKLQRDIPIYRRAKEVIENLPSSLTCFTSIMILHIFLAESFAS
ncbi:MAG: tyrosine-type recombinase/integrase [Ignavibacteriaceae bacterium]